ncbi:aspartate kinase [Candidatus Endomicrobiellum devescovinae]|uniref:aspartate kinase n=1 Tax=Candidatus Endomicrobiellum devescovinae TaxID=3242322 RepID=UPI002833677C|nr:aspartate kinase [Endomicrobium sp.]MDR1434324.1 aspartate kinase [Endomicrobium sp.]
MALVVMKFGGSSVADADKMKLVASRTIAKKNAGNKVVVVVSAPGDTTDELLEMADKITSNPPAREMDVLLATGEMISISLLAMAIDSMGEKAVSLTGPQAGILADINYTRARVKKVNPKKINSLLSKNNIVIVAGFQALNPKGDVTTLGRGGSDLTAVVLAAGLEADSCEIYSDVEGVYTTDPRLVKDAKKLEYISYDEMLEMAGSGAQVLQSRSVEVAKKFGVEIHARSTFSENQGTIITSEERIRRKKMEELLVSGITFDKNQVKFTIIDLPDIPGVAAKIFSSLAKIGINVDMIIQSAAVNKKNDISFTVSRKETKKTQIELDKIASEFKASQVVCDEHVAKISVVGIGMKSNAGVAGKMFEILHKKGINIEMISTSEIKISCIVDEMDMVKAVEELHKGFGLSKKK